MGPDLQLHPALEHLARAVARQQDAERALIAAALRVNGGAGTPVALRGLHRCEVLERRARLHVDLAHRALAHSRAALLDDQRRVPAVFRRIPPRTATAMEVLGTPAPRDREPRPAAHDRAAS